MQNESAVLELHNARLDVRFFHVPIRYKTCARNGELEESATAEDFSVVRKEGRRMVARLVRMYDLEAIISVGFRANSKLGIQFRRWANVVIQQHMMQGFSVNQRLIQMECGDWGGDDNLILATLPSTP